MRLPLASLALLSALVGASSAQAQTVVALTGDAEIVLVDAAARKAGQPVAVTGLSGSILGIDVRPSDAKLYALVSDGTIVTIDPKTGAATKTSTLATTLPAGVKATVDFNPVADRLRIIGSDGTNLRANVDDGKVTTDKPLAFAETDMHKGETPNVVAGAYTNAMAGAKETVLFDIDATIGGLLKQAPPNDGVLNAVGKLGVKADAYAFDIVTSEGGNAAWLMAGDTLHEVDLATGAAKPLGTIEGVAGAVRDIAALPEG